jgi:hypothetical protein
MYNEIAQGVRMAAIFLKKINAGTRFIRYTVN